jgi:hypothetical protein
MIGYELPLVNTSVSTTVDRKRQRTNPVIISEGAKKTQAYKLVIHIQNLSHKSTYPYNRTVSCITLTN